MLDLSSDIIQNIIDKAHEFHGQEQVVIPDQPDSSSDDWALQVLAGHAGDKTYQELRAVINDLEPDQQQELVALMWLGRGDFAVDEWDQAMEQARESWNRRTAEYLLSTPLVADFLEEGLSVLLNAEES